MDSLYPARNFLRAQDKNAHIALRKSWLRSIPDGYIANFMIQGLIPLLNRLGFSVGFTVDDCIKYCKEWAFSHLVKLKKPKSSIHLLKSANNDNIDELIVFQLNVNFDELVKFWAIQEFLDDETPVGQSQKLDLERFVWHLIDVANSKLYVKYYDSYSENNQDETQYAVTHQEDNAYGGDRRTY